ncbi:MAG: UDP-N-acetylmuramoyl-L-alanine--D-glutamate ligase [bacterium]|nr:UDP-N-acetylmuramoyl-L-alanine--D-glutamate ligase [bacterium]
MNTPLPSGKDLRGMRATVMGLGQFGGGLAAAQFLAEQGAEVCVTDLNSPEKLRQSCNALRKWPIRFVLGTHDEADFVDAQLVVANAAVPPSNRFLALARKKGARITSEMELFLHNTQAQLLLVSGTHGKSSTVTFLEQLLRNREKPVFLGGNIGRSLLNEPGAMQANAQCVIEISSYQLEALGEVHPKVHAAGLTALAPDHLERHKTLPEYLRCKARIFELLEPDALALLPAEWWDRSPFAEARAAKPRLGWQAYGADEDLGIRNARFHTGKEDLGAVADFHVHGDFQRTNLLLALGLAQSIGVSAHDLAARLPHISGLDHRLTPLPVGPGPTVFDNGVSTTPETTLAAVLSLPSPLVLLVGGQAKSGLGYGELAAACARRGDDVHLFGAAADDLEGTFRDPGGPLCTHSTLAEAIPAAWASCKGNQTLLFSPACASFDAFTNFRARAQFFLDQIGTLRGKH